MNGSDLSRFLLSIVEFNTLEAVGSLRELLGPKHQLVNRGSTSVKSNLVGMNALCVNPNHYHMILTPYVEKGIEKFMHRVSTGYTMYFNEKYHRSGSLFQGRYKAVHLDSNRDLLYVNAYVNLNDKVHRIPKHRCNLVYSTMAEYCDPRHKKLICSESQIVIGQFKNVAEYKKSCNDAVKAVLAKRSGEGLLLE